MSNIIGKPGNTPFFITWFLIFYHNFRIFCDVEPKRKALAEANEQLAAAETKLSGIKAKIKQLQDDMKELTDAFEEATAAKLKCQQEADATNLTISLANRLVGGLASENVRWAESVKNFKIQETMLPGDVLLITAFISYFGYFTKDCFQITRLFSYWSTNQRSLSTSWALFLKTLIGLS